MVIAQSLFFLISGFILLVLAGDKLVETSVALARRWNIPASVIAVTLIAAGTSAPELVTSFIAGLRGIGDISVGNVVGSNIFNILAIAGLTLIIQPRSDSSKAFFSWPILLLATGLFIFFLLDLYISQLEGLLFLLGINAFILFSFLRGEGADDVEDSTEKSLARRLVFFVLSFAGLILGAQLALRGGVDLGRYIGLSERVIGITIISVGTGLPELVTSLAAAARGHNDVAIANIVGSNVFNTLGIPGMTAAFFPLVVNEQIFSFDSLAMLAATLLIGLCFFIKIPILRRIFGFAFLSGYFLYVSKLLMGYQF